MQTLETPKLKTGVDYIKDVKERGVNIGLLLREINKQLKKDHIPIQLYAKTTDEVELYDNDYRIAVKKAVKYGINSTALGVLDNSVEIV